MSSADCLVIGAGPAGLACALALASVGVDVAVAGPRAQSTADADPRTAALFPTSLAFLANIGIWERVAPVSAPMRALRLIDDTGGLLRAPEVLFDAAEIGAEVLAYNVPNAPLVAALDERVGGHPGIARIVTTGVTGIELGSDSGTAQLSEGGSITAPLVVAADGRRSIARQAAGIAVSTWRYDQAAIAGTFRHSRPHGETSTEFHTEAGPLTTVPLPGAASSLVWLERPDTVSRLMALDDAGFALALETRLQGLLGTISHAGPRVSYPMAGLVAERYGANRVALIGETAHAFPPIGAQGLNLSLRDAAHLAELVGERRRSHGDVGGADLLSAYHDARKADVAVRTYAVDALNRSLIAGIGGLGLVRGAGLHLLNALSPLKRALMRQGLAPVGPLPRLLRDGSGLAA